MIPSNLTNQRGGPYRLVMELAEEKNIYGIGRASVEEIEKQNIVGATCMAMKRAMYDA